MRNKNKIMILEPIDYTELTKSLMDEHDIEYTFGPHVTDKKNGFTEKELIDIGNEYDAIIGMSREKITRKIIENSKRLKIIGKFGIGVDHIDIKAATENGIVVTNAPVITNTVAEFTISLILSLMKKVPYNDLHVREGLWRDSSTVGLELEGLNLGLVGMGGIGREIFKRFEGWGMNYLSYDPYITEEDAKKIGVKLVERDELFKKSDIICLMVPLTKETEGSVGEREFNMMKETAVLINTSRGKVVQHDALIKALKDKKIWGAALDVFENEPLNINNEILKLDNFIATPHTAGWTKESLIRMSFKGVQNCIDYLEGKLPDNIVNNEVVDKIK